MRLVCEREAAEMEVEASPLMGLQPIVPTSKLSPDPARWASWYIDELERDLRGRCSRFEWRRRRAYEACQRLIEHREHVCGLETWTPPPSPSVPAKPWQYRAVDYAEGTFVGGAGCIVAVVDDGEGLESLELEKQGWSFDRINVKKTLQ